MVNPFESINKKLESLDRRFDKLESQFIGSDSRTIGSSLDSQDTILDVIQAADFLGLKKSTIYEHVSKRKIPFSKVSKKLYFSKNDLVEWIKQSRRLTTEELSQKADLHIRGNVTN